MHTEKLRRMCTAISRAPGSVKGIEKCRKGCFCQWIACLAWQLPLMEVFSVFWGTLNSFVLWNSVRVRSQSHLSPERSIGCRCCHLMSHWEVGQEPLPKRRLRLGSSKKKHHWGNSASLHASDAEEQCGVGALCLFSYPANLTQALRVHMWILRVLPI